MIGDKHVVRGHEGEVGDQKPPGSSPDSPPIFSGGTTGGDGSIYNKSPHCVTRVAGPQTPLAKSPSDPFKLQFGSNHSGVCLFVFCDGSVKALSVDINPGTLGALATRNGGEAVSDADY